MPVDQQGLTFSGVNETALNVNLSKLKREMKYELFRTVNPY